MAIRKGVLKRLAMILELAGPAGLSRLARWRGLAGKINDGRARSFGLRPCEKTRPGLTGKADKARRPPKGRGIWNGEVLFALSRCSLRPDSPLLSTLS